MIVVSNTTPLNYLVLVEAVDVLPILYGELFVPPKGMAELQHEDTPPEVRSWIESEPRWLCVRSPKRVGPASTLHEGEAHAIALAEEMLADRILIDERKGRTVALERGLHVIDTLAVIDAAAAGKLIDLQETLRRLRATSFRYTNELEAELLSREKRRAAERST